MDAVTRRSFLRRGTVGALGVAGVAAMPGVAGAVVKADQHEAGLTPEEIEILNQPVLVQIRDAASGEVELLVADQSVVFTDKRLVAKVLRAAR